MNANVQYEDLKRRLAEIWDVGKAAALLSWDQQTMMPPRGAPVRADQLGTLSKIAHERFISDEIGRLLDDLRGYEESLPFESDEASLIRVARVTLRRHRQRLVERAATVRTRHRQAREERGRLAPREHAQQLDDRGRALDLA